VHHDGSAESALTKDEALILHWDQKAACGRDDSLTSVKDFLRELVSLAGQEALDVPVLELQIGEVLSRTTVETIGKCEYLAVIALLPRSKRSPYLSAHPARHAPENMPPRAAIILWNDDEQRYVATRRVPVSDLTDGRSVMDAILLTVDEAIGWFALLEKLHLK
jgi:hypothetical protein